MARVQARTNIYTALPMLATLIMVGGIAATWVWGIAPYRRPAQPTNMSPLKGRQNPDITPPEAPKPPEPIDEALLPKAPDEKAPAEEPGEKAPEAVPEKAPEAVPEKGPEAPEPPQEKAEDVEK